MYDASRRARQYAIGSAFACIGFTQTVSAADSVTLYGITDTFLTHVHADGTGAANRMDSSGLYASRFGLKGHEDIGSGYGINFVLENGFNANDGSAADSNRLFNRQAWVGVGSPWGELRFGRQNAPEWVMNGNFDAFTSATQASGWNNMFGTPPRADNAATYISPVVRGFKVQAMYARGATGGSAIADQVASNQNVHFGAEYASGPLYVGLNFEEIRNAIARNKARRTAGTISYSFTDALKAYLAVAKQTVSDDSQDNYLYSTSLLYSFSAAASLAVGYTFFQDRASGAGHGNASEAGVLCRYSLSKRTILYGAYSYLSQQGNQRSFVLGGAAVVEPGAHIVSTPGGNINGVQFGIVHMF